MYKFSIRIFLITLSFLSVNLFAGGDSPFVRYPDLNHDGSKISFTFQGDIWVVSSNGGKAERITIHEAYDGWPQWSSDDKTIAFSSNRFGNNDIFTIPASGGIPTRITYHSADDELYDFTRENKLLFTTSRTFKQVERSHEFAIVSTNGGTPKLLLDAVGEMPTLSPDGKFLAFTNGLGRLSREAYRGSANNDIWIYNTETESYKKITDFEGHDTYPRWADSRTIYFTSPRNGIYNIHKISIDDNSNRVGSIEQITNFTDDGVRFLNISGDGKSIVFEKETDIYLLNLANGKSKKVDIDISADYRFDPIEHKIYSNKISEYQVSPNGNYSVFTIRGEIFLTENDKEKNKTVNLSNHPYRDQNPAWLNDSSLVFVSDRDGQKDLYLIKSDDKKQTNLFKSLKHKIIRITETPEDESWPVISPNHKNIAYEVGRGKLVVGDIDKNGNITNIITMLDGWDAPGNVTWSPDSKWLAYSLNDLNFNQEIFIQPADNHIKPINVSMHPRGDANPVWSMDGKKLGFTSQRNNSDADVWFVWLNKEDWERTQNDWDEYEKPKEEKKEEAKPVIIDADNIYQRLVQVTKLDGNEGNIQFSEDGETVFFTSISPTKKGRDLFSIKWNGQEIKELTSAGSDPGNIKLSNDGNYLFFAQKGTLNRFDIAKNAAELIPFEAKMFINYPVEMGQKFEEGWRALRDGFYDPNYHGQNWNGLKNKYKPWCLQASTDKDFQDMYNLMLGQLNASHMGMYSLPDRSALQKEKTGLLGIRVEPAKNGVQIVHIVDNSPASKTQSKLEIGDIILSVNGNEIKNNVNFYELLINTVNENVLLNVNRNSKIEEVVIRPTSSLTDLLYDEWVENNRKLVDKYSNGRLGYLHIKAMGMPSFERFEREFTAQAYGKEAIVIDVRYNGGGWTTDYLMTVLNYKQHAYTIPRGAAKNLLMEKENFREYYPLGERLPFSAWTKPSIALCNQNSYSNAEIFSHAFKNLGIGKLVGEPTFGAVISTGAHYLIDGSYVRMPFRGWFVKADNTNMDFVPAVPDIIVENPVNEKTGDNDLQLKRAVEELLKELK